MKANTPSDFWAKVDRSGGPDACWPFLGCKVSGIVLGYGHFAFLGKMRMAHRLAFMFGVGPIPNRLLILHDCDNRPCCNPRHLYAGTHSDNIRDCMARGRHKPNRQLGEEHSQAKLTVIDVEEIRAMRGKCKQQVLADRYGITRSNVCVIQRGRSWVSQ